MVSHFVIPDPTLSVTFYRVLANTRVDHRHSTRTCVAAHIDLDLGLRL